MANISVRLAAKKEKLIIRARIVSAIRAFFIREGFLEVETPVVIPAPAPELNIDAPKADGGYLQTSPELAMKRLLAAGYPPIFQIARCFRGGERGRLHLPEFTMLEWYRPNADYNILMSDCQNLFSYLADSLELSRPLVIGQTTVDLQGVWGDVTVDEAYARFTGMSAEKALEAGEFDILMVEKVEPRLGIGTPTILKDYPAKLAALAKIKAEDCRVAERFEVYAAGMELANGFSELCDPIEQRKRFEFERSERAANGKDTYPFPERFIAELGSMPPSAGIALGVDRLVMLLTGASSIDEVTALTPEEL